MHDPESVSNLPFSSIFSTIGTKLPYQSPCLLVLLQSFFSVFYHVFLLLKDQVKTYIFHFPRCRLLSLSIYKLRQDPSWRRLLLSGHTHSQVLPTVWLLSFPGGSAGKESACSAGDLGSIPGLERSLGWKDPLEKGKATHFSILAWRIHGLQPIGSQKVGHD